MVFLLLVVPFVLVIVIDGPVRLRKVGLERLFHVRDVHALPLSEAVDDDGIPCEFVVKRPLLMTPFSEEAVRKEMLGDCVDGQWLNHERKPIDPELLLLFYAVGLCCKAGDKYRVCYPNSFGGNTSNE